MPLIPDNALDALAQAFTVVRTGPELVELGQPVQVNVLPPASNETVNALLVGSPLVQLPVAVGVQWSVFDQNQNNITANPAQVLPDIAGQEAHFLFAPSAMVELTNNLPAPLPVQRFIRATITISTTLGPNTSLSSAPYQLPDISVLVPPLSIPTILALFRFENYAPANLQEDPHAGAVVVIVRTKFPPGPAVPAAAARTVHLFNLPGCIPGAGEQVPFLQGQLQGEFTVSIGTADATGLVTPEMCTLLPNFNFNDNSGAALSTIPPKRAKVDFAPDAPTFDNIISSLRFDWEVKPLAH